MLEIPTKPQRFSGIVIVFHSVSHKLIIKNCFFCFHAIEVLYWIAVHINLDGLTGDKQAYCYMEFSSPCSLENELS